MIVAAKGREMVETSELQVGSDFVGYRIEQLIGRGGMGVVYRAYDLRLKRAVALKLVSPELALDERFRERFARETEAAMSLEHPNVVPVYDAGDVAGHFYLAMRLVEGADLRKLLSAEGRLSPPRALAICRQTCGALDAAHARGLVHRDVKPSNVLLDENEHVYLADFGLARRFEEQGAPTVEGRSVGTPAYLAPEQIEGSPVDGRADVYALGCLLFECLTGRPPFTSGSRLAVAWAHLEEEPPSARELDSELPEAIDAVIATAMAKDPGDRYPTCGALVAAAEEAFGLGKPTGLARRRRVLLAALGILVVTAAILAAFFATRGAGGHAAPPVPVVRGDSIARIDPKTNRVSRVIDVGWDPMAAAVGGRSVWSYNNGDLSVSEIDARTNTVRKRTAVRVRPVSFSLLVGPFLVADAEAAWLVGLDGQGRPVLTKFPSGGGEARRYRLDRKPLAVAVGQGGVWVVGRSARDNQVLQVDPATGEVTRRVVLPHSARIDSLDTGLGFVWAGSSSTATVYRIDPRSATLAGRIDVGTRSGRPEVEFGRLWIGVSDGGGGTLLINARTLETDIQLNCCELSDGYDAVDRYGSTWTTDWWTGTIERWNGHNYQITATIRITDPPFYAPGSHGLCLTSLAAGAGGIWVTLADAIRDSCKR
jgi:serine/threonine-protein kinase